MRFRLLFQCWLTVIVLLGTFSANAWANEFRDAKEYRCDHLFFKDFNGKQVDFPGINKLLAESKEENCTRFGMRVDNGAVVFSPVVASIRNQKCDGDEKALVHGENKEPVWCGSTEKASTAHDADWSEIPHVPRSRILEIQNPENVEEEIRDAISEFVREKEIKQLGKVWRHAFFKSAHGSRLPNLGEEAENEFLIDDQSNLVPDVRVQIGLLLNGDEPEECKILGTLDKVTKFDCGDTKFPKIRSGDQETFTFFLFDHTRESTATPKGDGYLVKGSIEVIVGSKDDTKVYTNIPADGGSAKPPRESPVWVGNIINKLVKALIFIVFPFLFLWFVIKFVGSRKGGDKGGLIPANRASSFEQKGYPDQSESKTIWLNQDHGGHVEEEADSNRAQSPDPRAVEKLTEKVSNLKDQLRRAQQALQEERQNRNLDTRGLNSQIDDLHGQLDKWKHTNEKQKGMLAKSEHELKDTNEKLSIFEDAKRLEDERKRNLLARPVVQGLTEQVLLVYSLPVLRKAVDDLYKAVDSGEQGTSVIDHLQAGIAQVEEVLEQARNLKSVPLEYLQDWDALLQEARMGQQTYRMFLLGVSRNKAFEKEGVLHMIEHPDFSASDSDTAKGAFKAWSDVLRVPPDTPNDDGLEMAKTFQREVVQKWLWPTIRLLKFVTEALPVEVPSLAANIRLRSELNKMASGSTLFFCRVLLKDLKFEWDPIGLYQHSLGYFTQYSNVDQRGVSWDEVGKGLPFPEGVEPGIICRVGMLRITKAPNDCWFANAKILAVRG